jgi:prolyl-tRNA editing enzyme YbaK/EbsC (Cys-tRNA(Pro) deacylase)
MGKHRAGACPPGAAGVPPLAAEDHACADCGIRYPQIDLTGAASVIGGIMEQVSDVVLALPLWARNQRPAPATWSVAEYVCHLRDVYVTYTIRLHRSRTEDRPVLEPMLNDLRACRFRYIESDVAVVLGELADTASGFCEEVVRAEPYCWGRVVTRLPGEERTARWLVRQAVHEGVHHLGDIRQVGVALGSPEVLAESDWRRPGRERVIDVQNVAVKVVVTPLLIGGASLAGRRWGHQVSGWLVGLPLTSGPVAFFLVTEQGHLFAAQAAVGMLAGTTSQLIFALAYRYTPSVGWGAPLAAGCLAFAAATVGFSYLRWPAWPVFGLVITSLVVGYALIRRTAPVRESITSTKSVPRWDIPVRMLVATGVVLAITASAPLMGARLAGLLSPFPVFGGVLVVFTHHGYGRRAAIAVLDGLVLGWFAPAVFFLALALALPAIGLAAFAVAACSALVTQGVTLFALPRVRESPVSASAPATAPVTRSPSPRPSRRQRMDGTYDRIAEYLDSNGIKYEAIRHEPAGSAEEYHQVLGTRYEQQAKSVFLRVRRPGEKSFAVLAIQAQKRADLPRAAALLGAREVKLATREQLEQQTGCTFGELAPFGRLYGVPVLIDADLLNQDEIYFNAGDLSISLRMSPTALRELEQAQVYSGADGT